MKKQITTIMLAIIMLAGAMAMYSGESITFKTNLTTPVYTVLGNSSNLEGLTIEFENGNITIITDLLMASDNFTLIFFDEITKEVVHTVYSGGGGSSTKYVDKNVTIYEVEYINTTKEIEVEKIIDNTTIIETGYEWWHILLAMVVGIVFGLYIMRKKKHKVIDDSETKIKGGKNE